MKCSLPLELTTERCILRRPGVAHAADLFAIYGDAETMQFMQKPPVGSVAECEDMLVKWDASFSSGSSFRWGVFLKSDPSRMIGTAALHYWSPSNRRVELGADLVRQCWGKGLATEVTCALIDCAFGVLGVNRIEIRCHPGNTGSVTIATKLGFRHEGTLRQYVFVPGIGMVDEAVYSLLVEDR